jgi:hypothetical protein
MCPFYQAGNNHFTLPVVTIQALNINYTTSIISSNVKFLKNNNDFINIVPMTGETINKKSTTTAGASNFSLLRFNRYSSSSNATKLNIYPGTIRQQDSSNTKCSAFTFLFASDIVVGTGSLVITDTGGTVSMTPYYWNNNVSFSLFGKSFNQMAVAINPTSITVKNDANPTTSTEESIHYLTSVNRPTIDYFYDSINKKFVTTDKIGFFCTSSADINTAYLTNLVIDTKYSSNVFNLRLFIRMTMDQILE